MRQVKVAALTLVLASVTSAQNTPTSKVLVPLIVMNQHKQVVTALTPASLIITEHKKPVTDVELLHGLDLPLELGILIDTSRSEQESGNLNRIFNGAKDFVADVVRGQDDRFFLMSFNEKAQATGWLKREQLSGVSLDVKLDGATTLYDSLAIACRDRMGPRDWNNPTRRILVIVSDGDDNQSHMTRDQAVSEALQSGAVIFAVDTRQFFVKTVRGDKILEYFAEVSGGEFFGGFTSKEIPKVFQQMKLISEGMYYARYLPPLSNNRVHELEIKPVAKEKLEISYPKKYLWFQ